MPCKHEAQKRTHRRFALSRSTCVEGLQDTLFLAFQVKLDFEDEQLQSSYLNLHIPKRCLNIAHAPIPERSDG